MIIVKLEVMTEKYLFRYVYLRSVKDCRYRTGFGYGSTRGEGCAGNFKMINNVSMCQYANVPIK